MRQPRYILLSVLIAFLLWFAAFVIRPFNFWLMMSANTVILSVLALAAGTRAIEKKDLTPANFLIGIASAAGLYGLFWAGGKLLFLIPGHQSQLESIYATRSALPAAAVAALLFFPIGFGEELFWRGFVQTWFAGRYSKPAALALTAAVYTAVHVPTLNPVLIIAAAVCGVYWGALYLATGSLLPVLISHMLWDPFIFVIRPLM